MIKKNSHRISLILPKKDFDAFERSHPHCLSRFLRNCIVYGASDKDFFESVFFMELDDTVKNCVVNMVNRLDGVL